MKNILKLVLIIALAGVLSGCYPTTRRASKGGARIDEIMSVAEKIDNFSVSLTLPESYPLELPKIKTTGLRFDKNTIFDTFISGESVELEEQQSDTYPNEIRYWCSFNEEEKSFLVFEPEELFYNSSRSQELHYNNLSSYADQFTENELMTYENELNGFSRESAIQRVREVAERFGITNLGEPRVYGISAEAANKYFRNVDAQDEYFGETPEHMTYTKDDEAYYIKFPQVYEGIPRETSDVNVPEYYYDTCSYVSAIVTKDKILRLDCNGITSPEYKTGENVRINFSAADILQKIVSDHSNIVHTEKINYFNCELVYAPEKFENGEWTFIPVWKFEYSTDEELNNDYYKNVVGKRPMVAWITRDYYNANTGNIILNGY